MAKRKFGEAQVEVSIRSRVGEGIKAIERRMKAFGMRMRAIGGSVAGVGAIATGTFGGVGAALIGATNKFGTFGDQIQKTSIRLNTSAKFLTGLKFAAEQSGSSLESVANAMFRANRRIANATQGTGPAVRALTDLGLSADKLNKLSTEDRFLAITEALSGMQNETLAAQYGFEIFGDNFRDIKPLIDEGADGIHKLMSEAKSLGLTLSDEDANGAAAYADAMNRMKQAVGGAVVQVGAALAPAISLAANVLAKVVAKVSDFIRRNRGMIVAIGAAVTVAFSLGAALTTAGVAIAAIGVAVSGFAGLIGALGTIVGVVLSPMGLLVAAIAGIAGATVYAAGGLTKLGDMFGGLRDTATSAWGGIVAAISSGDMALAGSVAFTALKIGWMQLTIKMQEIWFGVLNYLRGLWLNTVEGIIHLGAGIYFGVSKYFDMLGSSLVNGFDTGFTYIQGGIDRIQTAIAKAIISAGRFFGMFSKEEAAQIQDTLDADLRRRAEGRESGLGRRIGERGQGLAERNARREQNAADFASVVVDQFDRERADKFEPDTKGLTEAEQELKLLNSRLANQVQQARDQATSDADKTKPPTIELPDLGSVFSAQTQVKALGTSSAAAISAGALTRGRDDNQRKTAQNTQKTNTLLLRLLQKRNGFR